MRSLIAAIRAVKLYPPNNPVYSQSVQKAHEFLTKFLAATPEYRIGVNKTYFTYLNTPFGKDTDLNKTVAQDLFTKEVREIIFTEGVTAEELLVLLTAFALSSEEMAMKSGISSILWEFGAAHIKVVESGLDDVITGTTDQERNSKAAADASDAKSGEKNASQFTGRTLVLGNLIIDPAGFGASMVELAKQTRGAHESVEDRLYALYQEAGHKIRQENPGQGDALFEGLAQSLLSLEPRFRDGLVAGKLYAELDAEIENGHAADSDELVPNELHELQGGRYSRAWTVQQVATLLKKTPDLKTVAEPLPADYAALESEPIPKQITEEFAPDMAVYSAKEMEALKAMSGVGMESDIIQAAVRTLLLLIPLVKNPSRPESAEKELKLFSGVIRQLEDMLGYLHKKKDYALAALIVQALHSEVEPAFKPRMAEALKKSVSKSVMGAIISDMMAHQHESTEYLAAYAYLKTLDREATSRLLDLLAEEEDPAVRLFLLDLLKDFGKNQVALVGEQLFDSRWFVVRNAVRILGDTRVEQGLAFLHKIADHKDVRIRQEIVLALISIGGRKAAGILARYLKDKDLDIQVAALRGIGELQGLGDMEAQYVMDFAELRPLKQSEQKYTIEAIAVLGRIGGRESLEFLARYTNIRWWKPRKLQEELRAAALPAMEEIKRRRADAGR